MPVNAPLPQRQAATTANPSSALRRGSGPRFAALAALCGSPNTLLDVGCRDRALEAALPGSVRYTGLDLAPPADVVASAEERLPFDDDAFETLVYADVLEHLNTPHFALGEATRVASRSIVLALPNVFLLTHRLGFLRGQLPTSKYDFGPVDPGDRHRWLMNVSQARHFAHGCAAAHGWQVADEFAYDGAPRRFTARAAIGLLARASGPDLWASTYMARLEPTPAP